MFNDRVSFSTISYFFDIQASSEGTNFIELEKDGWSSFISGIPSSTGLLFAFGNEYLDATVDNKTISNYSLKQSFKEPVTTWSYTWSPDNTAASFNITFQTIFSRERPNVAATKATITPSADVNGTITDLLDGRSALRTFPESSGLEGETPTIFSLFHPDGLGDKVTGAIFSTANFSATYTDITSREFAEGPGIPKDNMTTGQTFNITLKAGESATFYKFVGVASTDRYASEFEGVAKNASLGAAECGWDILIQEHITAWAQNFTVASVDDFSDPATGDLPADDENSENTRILQIASVVNPFYILQNLQGGDNDAGIAVGGLVSDSYGGLAFWDQDYWMAPGIQISYPGYAKQITGLRIKQHNQSIANAVFNGYTEEAALYSWCTGRYGNCTGTGPCADYEYHLNYDVAFNIEQMVDITNDVSWYQNGPVSVVESAAFMTTELLKWNQTTGTYWIHNMTDPDEYAVSSPFSRLLISLSSNCAV